MRTLAACLFIFAAVSASCANVGTNSTGSGAGGGGGESPCDGKSCGEPCETCSEPPCNQLCDEVGECRKAGYVTCTACPDGQTSWSQGDDCPQVGLRCEYPSSSPYDEEFADCRSSSECTVTGWDKASAESDCYQYSPDAPTCLMVMPNHGTPCDRPSFPDFCNYEAGSYCACTNCLSGVCDGSYYWGCVTPPGGDCPVEAPFFGHSCSQEGLDCVYGACFLELEQNLDGTTLLSTHRRCEGGMWVEKPMNCGS